VNYTWALLIASLIQIAMAVLIIVRNRRDA
jgi:hypothetical protein